MSTSTTQMRSTPSTKRRVSAHAMAVAGTPIGVVVDLMHRGAVVPDLILYAAGLSAPERARHRRRWARTWGRPAASFKSV